MKFLCLLLVVLSYNLFQPKAERLLVITEKWCTPCRKLRPHLEQLKREGYDVRTYTIVQWSELKPKLTNLPEVESIPTVLYILKNKVIRSHKGGKNADYIKQYLCQVRPQPTQ